MSKVIVYIIQQTIPEYRVAFFNELSRLTDLTVFYSSSGLEKNIENASSKNFLYNSFICKSYVFFKKVIIQSLPFGKMLRSNIIIFEFNIRILTNVFFMLLRKVFRKKVILWGHGIKENMSTISRETRLFLINRSDAIIVYEDAGKDYLMTLGIEKDKIFIIKNSIDLNPIYKLVNSEIEKYRITFIGRIIKEKNVELLIKSFLHACESIPSNIVLSIIGEGDEKKYLVEKYAHNYQIEFLGKITDETKISKYMNETLFTVSPDNVGLMVHHSFAYGVPIIVNEFPVLHHGPEVQLVVHDKTGWFFDGTKEGLSDIIIKNINDIDICKHYGINGQSIMKKEYGIENMAMNMLKAIKYVEKK